MPAKSQAQREALNAKFGHAWVKKHDFGNKGKLPAHKHKHKMNNPSKLIRLARIDSGLDTIIKFQNEEDDKKNPYLKGAAIGTAGVGAGAGGVLLHRAVQNSGGYGANIMAMRRGGQDLVGQATGNVAAGTGAVGARLAPLYSAGKSAAGAGANVAKAGVASGAAQLSAGKAAYGLERTGLGAAESAGSKLGYKGGALLGKGVNWLGKLAKPLLGRFGLESKDKPIKFGSEILGPWQGKTGHTSKIDQLEFPAAPSPLQLMQFPLPVLMRYLNQRNLQQQVFSWKQERLIQLSSKVNDLIELDAGWDAFPTQANYYPGIGGTIRYQGAAKTGFKEHLKRNAGRYIGTGAGLAAAVSAHKFGGGVPWRGIGEALADEPVLPLATGATGLLAGSVVDQSRKHHAIRRAVGGRVTGDMARIEDAAKKQQNARA